MHTPGKQMTFHNCRRFTRKDMALVKANTKIDERMYTHATVPLQLSQLLHPAIRRQFSFEMAELVSREQLIESGPNTRHIQTTRTVSFLTRTTTTTFILLKRRRCLKSIEQDSYLVAKVK